MASRTPRRRNSKSGGTGSRIEHLRRDERGMSFAFVGIGFMAFLAATMLAVDVGMLMTARVQAQNAADSAAFAGAIALVFDDFNDRSPSGPAVQSAIASGTSAANSVMGQSVSLTPEDVTFPVSPSGEANRVQVTVFRVGERGNPLGTLLAGFFGRPTADIAATATAEASPANGMSCVKPFTIPDKWIEMQTPPWSADDTFDMYDNRGNLLPNPDIYIPADRSGYTGYNQEINRGERLMIRAGTGNNIVPTFYYSIAIGGVTGGSQYEWNIANCNTHVMLWGDLLLQEPGNMVGPTTHGVKDLIDRDPGAYWDEVSQKPAGSSVDGQSPRVFPIPLYDPVYYTEGRQQGRFADLKVANWIGFFLEEVQGNNIWGRIIPITGIVVDGAPVPENAFPRAIRLVE